MEVRRADFQDLNALVDFTNNYHPKTIYKDIPINDRDLRGLFLSCISPANKDKIMYIAIGKGGVCGYICGGVEPYPFNSRKLFGTDFLFIADKGGALLFRKLWNWCKRKGKNKCDRMIMGTSTCDPTAGSMYKLLGFEEVGGMYSKKLHND